MEELDLEAITKSGIALVEWETPKIKQYIRSFKEKERIELILNRIIKNNYELSMDIRELMKDNYGPYEDSWGAVLKSLESYPLRCESVIKLAIKRKWIKLNPKAKCKVKIRKIDKIDDACWGFTTIKRKMSDELKHFTINYYGKDVEIFGDPSCPKGEIWIKLEKLDTGEFLFGVFSFL